MIQHLPVEIALRYRPRVPAAACILAAATLGIVEASPLEFPAPAVTAEADGPVETADDDARAAAAAPRVPRLVALVGVDTPGDPAGSSRGGDSPVDSSGPFDATRQDLGEDDDLAVKARRRKRDRGLDRPADIDKLPDPLRGTPPVNPQQTGADADALLRKMLQPRSDSWADWSTGTEPLHFCGEPRWLPPCVPPPPCHPSLPPRPYDLVGVRGEPTGGPIYGGPCQPRTGTHDDCPHPHLHRLHDRLFDLFYMWK